MQESTFTNYDQLPLFLNANTVAQVLGVSISSAYELMHETGFPALRIGNRIVVPKEKFRQWVDAQAGGKAIAATSNTTSSRNWATSKSPSSPSRTSSGCTAA